MLILALLGPGAATPVTAQSLPDLQRRALAVDPAVAGAEAQVRAAEQRVVQARAAFGPTVGITANQTETRYREAPNFDLRPFRSKQLALQVTQPLFRTALFPGLDAAQAQFEQAQAALAQARIESTQRLVEACFEVLEARDALALARAQRVATAEQLALARRSFTVGTVPVTDVREAEARADAVAAQVQAAEFDPDLRQQVLAELAAGPAPGLLVRGLDAARMPRLGVSSATEWPATAYAQSWQLRQSEQALLVAEAEVGKARQGHAPTADLTYQQSMSSDTGTVTSAFPRRGDISQVGVNINIPLFASGATQARVRETLALRDKVRSDADQTRRTVTLGVRQQLSAALAAIAQVRGLEAAVRSQELSFRANRRGYEVGLKVNAQVLDAQGKLFEARRDLSRARYDAWLAYIRLQAAAGTLSETDLAELDGLLLVVETPDLRVVPPRLRRPEAP